MTFEIAFMLALILAALVLFVLEVFPIEVTAMLMLAVLLLTGIINGTGPVRRRHHGCRWSAVRHPCPGSTEVLQAHLADPGCCGWSKQWSLALDSTLDEQFPVTWRGLKIPGQ